MKSCRSFCPSFRPRYGVLAIALLCHLGLGQTSRAQAQNVAGTSPLHDAATPAGPRYSSAKSPAQSIGNTPTEQKKQDSTQQQVNSPDVHTVTVVAQRAAEQIDRSVYDVKSEVVTPNASVADVISNVPNVTVDQEGKVSIRGNRNAKVYVDGKPSAMFSGANAGDALNSYPAEALESIEVITTPGAEFGSDGGNGPILNLLTRRVRSEGSQGQISLNKGLLGRGGISLNGSYVTGRLQVEGFGSITREVSESRSMALTDTSVGDAVWKTNREGASSTPKTVLTFNPTLRYNIGETDRFTAGFNVSRSKLDGRSTAYYYSYHGSVLPYEAYDSYTTRRSLLTLYQATLSWERRFSATEKLNVDLRSSGSISDTDSRNRNSYIIEPPTNLRPESTVGNDVVSRLIELSFDYSKRLSPTLNLKAGAKVGRNNSHTNVEYFDIDRQTGSEMEDEDRASGFRSTERTYAIYFSPNVRLSQHWTVLPGLRYERMARHIDYLRKDNSVEDNSAKILPSMHLQYGWGEQGASVTGAYSRRITRPSPNDLNPNLQYVNDQTYTQGDPRLAPMRGDKYELKYTDTWAWLNSNVSLFREKDSPLLARLFTPLLGSAALVSKAINFGAKTNDGISWNLQAKPSSDWRLNTTISYRRIAQSYLTSQSATLGANSLDGVERKSTSKGLQLGMQYYGFPGHTLQLNGNYTGQQLTGLLETRPNWQVHANWMWRITPTWMLRAGIRDIFESNKYSNRLITGPVQQKLDTVLQGRILNFALSYSFGGVTGDAKLRNSSATSR